MRKKWLALAAAGALLAGALSGCFGGASPTPAPTDTSTPAPTQTVAPSPSAAPTPAPADRPAVNVAMLNGPTGMGAAKLMMDAEAGETANDYAFTVYTDNSEVTAALVQGTVDVAALATNVAANLYRKTEGGVQLAAINTYGVLKILQGGEGKDITSLAGLKGKRVCAVGQGANPEYVLNFLLTENGLEPDKDLDILWMSAEEVTQNLLSGKEQFAMLPVPAATAACLKSQGGVRQVLDLSEEWDDVTADSRLTMGCVVVRTAFARENPQAVRTFLEEYEASIAYMTDPASLAVSSDANPANLLEHYGIVPSAAIGGKALEQANLTFVSGVRDLRDAIQGYYEVLYAANPTSIGGGIPDDGFYFE